MKLEHLCTYYEWSALEIVHLERMYKTKFFWKCRHTFTLQLHLHSSDPILIFSSNVAQMGYDPRTCKQKKSTFRYSQIGFRPHVEIIGYVHYICHVSGQIGYFQSRTSLKKRWWWMSANQVDTNHDHMTLVNGTMEDEGSA